MYRLIIISIIASLFYSCSKNNHRADAYGNFEAIETIISAEANGKLLEFNLQEGMEITKGQQIGIIDTTDLYLKKHPHLKEFCNAPTTAFIRISIKRYFMVNRFQNVVEVKVKPWKH